VAARREFAVYEKIVDLDPKFLSLYPFGIGKEAAYLSPIQYTHSPDATRRLSEAFADALFARIGSSRLHNKEATAWCWRMVDPCRR
jgi:hypothetical protein